MTSTDARSTVDGTNADGTPSHDEVEHDFSTPADADITQPDDADDDSTDDGTDHE